MTTLHGDVMKKKFALLILLALALTAILAACNNPDATQIIPRWSTDGETYVYNVSLADFAESGNSRFTSYSDNGETYYKDFLVRVGEPLDDLDEVRPAAVTGTYTMTVSHLTDDKYDRVETKLELLVSYLYENGKISVGKDKWIELSAELAAVGEVTGKHITFDSTTETMVEFNRHDGGKQAPRKSSTKVDGFYLGKSHQEISAYEIATEYDYSGKKTVAKSELKMGGKTDTISETLKRYGEGSFIDSNQLFTYTRSFDKTSTSFQDNPSVAVYNPFNQQMQSASFTFTASANAVLTRANEQPLYAKLPTVGVAVGGMPFMLQESAPNMLDQKADRTQYGEDWFAKHTPVRFRVGYISYELNYEVGTPADTNQGITLWDALKNYSTKQK